VPVRRSTSAVSTTVSADSTNSPAMYLPMPSSVGPRSTLTPNVRRVANSMVLLGLVKIASPTSRPTLAAWMSKADATSMSPMW